MAKINPVSYEFYMKQGDLYPSIRIRILLANTDDDPFVLTGYTGKFYMAPYGDKTNPKIDGVAVTLVDAANGIAEYQWILGDTDTVGRFEYEFEFTKAAKPFTVPVISPGVIVIQRGIG